MSSESLSEKYGDGLHIPLDVVLPLTNIPKENGVLNGLPPVIGGLAQLFAKFAMSVQVANKVRLKMDERLPPLPKDYLSEVKITRLFFYIEPVKGEKRHRNWFSRFFGGQADVNFDFINKVAIKLGTAHVERDDYLPKPIENVGLDPQSTSTFMNVFKQDAPIRTSDINPDANEILLLKYEKKNKNSFIQNRNFGTTFIAKIAKGKSPATAKHFFQNHPKLQGFFARTMILADDDGSSVLLEMKKDPAYDAALMQVVSDFAVEVDEAGVEMIEPCTENTCLDLVIPDVNLVSLITKDNGIVLDSFIMVDKAPSTFKAKGFLQLGIKFQILGPTGKPL